MIRGKVVVKQFCSRPKSDQSTKNVKKACFETAVTSFRPALGNCLSHHNKRPHTLPGYDNLILIVQRAYLYVPLCDIDIHRQRMEQDEFVCGMQL
jgi:hypothetical protein